MKETKADKRKRKEHFLNEIYPKLKEDFITREIQNGIKIEVGGREYDYYPGGQKIRIVRSGTITKDDWRDFTVEEFLKSIKKYSRKFIEE